MHREQSQPSGRLQLDKEPKEAERQSHSGRRDREEERKRDGNVLGVSATVELASTTEKRDQSFAQVHGSISKARSLNPTFAFVFVPGSLLLFSSGFPLVSQRLQQVGDGDQKLFDFPHQQAAALEAADDHVRNAISVTPITTELAATCENG
jgi:hypothetical protein